MALLDNFCCYNQIRVKRIDKYKTTFTTRWGTFSYERIPFVLFNAGATFHRDMQIDFDYLIGNIIQIYLDDLTVYFKNRSDLFYHLKQFFLQCWKFGLSLNPSKSIFGITQGQLLGHIVSNSGISIDPKRVNAILYLPTPTSKKEIQSSMGRINLVRGFVLDFIVMVKPIHNMLKQDQYFSWMEYVKRDFLEIKKAIKSAPILEKTDFNKEFMIYTKSIEAVIYVVLLQKDGQNNE